MRQEFSVASRQIVLDRLPHAGISDFFVNLLDFGGRFLHHVAHRLCAAQFHVSLRDLRGIFRRVVHIRVCRLRNCLVEKSFCGRDNRQHHAGNRARAFSENGDIVGIPAEIRDIFLDPLQSRDLIFQPEIAAVFKGRIKTCEVHKAKDRNTIVKRDDNDVVCRRKIASAIKRVAGAAGLEAAAVDKDHDGFVFALAARPNVQRQAVFALRVDRGSFMLVNRLYRRKAEFFGVEGLVGRFQRLGRAPTQFSDGRLGIGDAQPSFYGVLIQKTAECAIAGFYGAIACGKNFLVRQDAKRTESQGAHSGGFDKFSAGYFWEHNITTFLLAWSNPSKAIIPGQKISSVPIQNL